MLGLSFFFQKTSANKTCPIEFKEDCETTKDWSRPLWIVTLLINLIGAFYAFLLPKLL
jgi:hypothetical protein